MHMKKINYKKGVSMIEQKVIKRNITDGISEPIIVFVNRVSNSINGFVGYGYKFIDVKYINDDLAIIVVEKE